MSAPTEAIPPPDIIFKGTDGNECDSFVAAIRNYAFETGRDEDLRWMLRFATARLRGKALRWHARLDPSIANDWLLFIQALFDQYPSVEGASEAEIGTPVWSITTFSSSPSPAPLPMNPEANRSVFGRSIPIVPNSQAEREESHDSPISNERTSSTRQYDASSTGRQIGLLRIVDMKGTTVPQYVWWDIATYSGSHSTTTSTTINRHEAPVVSFLPSSSPHAVGYLNPTGSYRNLSLSWDYNPEVEYYAVLGCRDGGIITPAPNRSGCVARAWNVLPDGTLQATMSAFSQRSGKKGCEETKFTTTEVHINTTGDDIRFAKPGALLEQDKADSNPIRPFFRARIVFEPL